MVRDSQVVAVGCTQLMIGRLQREIWQWKTLSNVVSESLLRTDWRTFRPVGGMSKRLRVRVSKDLPYQFLKGPFEGSLAFGSILNAKITLRIDRKTISSKVILLVLKNNEKNSVLMKCSSLLF